MQIVLGGLNHTGLHSMSKPGSWLFVEPQIDVGEDQHVNQ